MKHIFDFWGLVEVAVRRDKRLRDRHYPAGCRYDCWDLGDRQVLVVVGRGQVATYSGEAPSA
ncbi:MAG: hypothetical protein E6R03_13970 [Hyphomicrobiaceae bacterium]|nr:MAG: hypothetical protein E6R03_13970 [Hyphomicrobiaceae bacterium]